MTQTIAKRREQIEAHEFKQEATSETNNLPALVLRLAKVSQSNLIVSRALLIVTMIMASAYLLEKILGIAYLWRQGI
jgi:hypothetical protein